MNLNFLTKYRSVNKLLLNNVGYIGERCYQIAKVASGNCELVACESAAPLMIVARQHYEESWATYSSLSLKELKSLLALQQSAAGFKPLRQIVENKSQDGFDVKTITFSADLLKWIPANTALLAETQLLTLHFTPSDTALLSNHTPSGRLFLAWSKQKIHSAYAKGLMANIERFKLSIGVNDSEQVQEIAQAQYGQHLISLLENAPLSKLIANISFDAKQAINMNKLHALYLAPIAVATLFLVASNSYLWFSHQQLQNQVSEQGSSIGEVLKQKRENDRNHQLISVLAAEVNQVERVHSHWNILEQAINSGMQIKRFATNTSGIELRGTADNASKVLTEINQLKQVKSAIFVGSVRKSRGQDSFVINLELSSQS